MQRKLMKLLPSCSPQNRRGFGLTELLIAIALFSTAFLFLLGTLTASNHALKQSSDRLYAMDFAERLMEEQKSKPYASIVDYDGISSVTYRQNGNPVVLDFIYNVDATEVVAGGTTRPMKDVLVSVSWTNRYVAGQERQQRTVRLETAVAE